MNLLLRTACIATGLLTLSSPVLAQPSPLHDFTLDNGLRVLVREDHRAPVVTSQLWLKVGASHERPGQSGLSHLLEHLVFLGSQKTVPGQFSEILERLGANENAFTTPDLTVYFQTLPSDHLEVALELTADLLDGASLSDATFDSEIEVVKAERRESVPPGMPALYEQLQAVAHPMSSYRTPVIGWEADLERVSNQEVRDWYRTWYAPNNAVLVVVGAVTRAKVEAMVRTHFAALEARPLPTVKAPVELSAPGLRTLTQVDENSTPMLYMAFNVPSYGSGVDARDINALFLAQSLLALGKSARLHSGRVYDAGLLEGPQVHYDPFVRGDTLFTLQAHVNASNPQPLAAPQAALWRELQALKDNPPGEAELQRAKVQLSATAVYNLDSLEDQAKDIGARLGHGLPMIELAAELALIDAITPADIQRVATAYFTRERLSTAYLLAKEADHE